MKSFLKIIIVMVILITIPVACVKVYKNHSKKKETDTKISYSEDTNSDNNTGPNRKLYSVEELPRVDASVEAQKLMTAFLSDFTREDIDIKKLEYSNEDPDCSLLVDGKKDLLIITEPTEEDLEYASSKDIKLMVVPIAKTTNDSSMTYCIVFRDEDHDEGTTRRIVYDMISLRGKNVIKNSGYVGIN